MPFIVHRSTPVPLLYIAFFSTECVISSWYPCSSADSSHADLTSPPCSKPDETLRHATGQGLIELICHCAIFPRRSSASNQPLGLGPICGLHLGLLWQSDVDIFDDDPHSVIPKHARAPGDGSSASGVHLASAHEVEQARQAERNTAV